ncbi:hypothetical protein K466DRAFT_494982 [Polyporus arcularius HHB13444]|uniref:F-box domain-containing protein n=1 Tax=Polyporus arcularius HHB13444 TaxID=1314778 RepID=A0A5C3P8V5_9APHY|nr:hypothetical protein K466DRAFT_494982 [Polyporus arcularius HHB13444]
MSHVLTPFSKSFQPELEEQFIDELCDNVFSLRSCALTCRAWRIRSHLHLLRAIRIGDSDTLNGVYDLFHRYPSLALCVRSLATDVYCVTSESTGAGIVHTPRIADLLNLRRLIIQLSDASGWKARHVSFHPAYLTALRIHPRIEQLCLFNLKLSSYEGLMQLLAALPNLSRLECSNLSFENLAGVRPGSVFLRRHVPIRTVVVCGLTYSTVDSC